VLAKPETSSLKVAVNLISPLFVNPPGGTVDVTAALGASVSIMISLLRLKSGTVNVKTAVFPAISVITPDKAVAL
jgi:hypothetical protein